jgi:hypothetical protein
MGYQPSHDIDRFNFEQDLAFGHEGEAIVRDFLTRMSEGDFEVKYDRYRNGNMAIETEQNPRGSGWKPSGINVTGAHWWTYLFAPDAMLTVSASRLKNFLSLNEKYLTKKTFASQSDNPARGYILTPPFVTDLLVNESYDGE